MTYNTRTTVTFHVNNNQLQINQKQPQPSSFALTDVLEPWPVNQHDDSNHCSSQSDQ